MNKAVWTSKIWEMYIALYPINTTPWTPKIDHLVLPDSEAQLLHAKYCLTPFLFNGTLEMMKCALYADI